MRWNHFFGGFVRDNINSLTEDLPIGRKDFRDIDVWVTDDQTGIQIIDSLLEMKLMSVRLYRNPYEGHKSVTFDVVHPIEPSTALFKMDMVVCENFPVRDVDINCLAWQDGQLKVFQNPEIEYVPDVDTICQKILEKTGTALRHKEDPTEKFKDYCRRYRHMTRKGFTIDYHLGGVQVDDIPNRGIFVKVDDTTTAVEPLGSTAKRA